MLKQQSSKMNKLMKKLAKGLINSFFTVTFT